MLPLCVNGNSKRSDYCRSNYDSILCWPETKSDTISTQRCNFGEKSNHEGFATRYCDVTGNWSNYTNYTQCIDALVYHDTTKSEGVRSVRDIYLLGYSLSILSLFTALVLFLSFKKLRCLRNIIHCNLILSFLARNLMWIILVLTIPHISMIKSSFDKNVCLGLHYIYHYTNVSNFCWMFVEGFHLHTIIVLPFKTYLVSMKFYLILGWGIPLAVVNTWAGFSYAELKGVCDSSEEYDQYGFIYKIPIILLLLGNMGLMTSILRVVCTKLRSLEQPAIPTQYSKALRSMFILFPLLGVNYVVLITPMSSDGDFIKLFISINAVLQSTQGFLVSLLYCFINGEVTNTIRTYWTRWMYSRDIGLNRTSMTLSSTMSRHRLSSVDVPPSSNRTSV